MQVNSRQINVDSQEDLGMLCRTREATPGLPYILFKLLIANHFSNISREIKNRLN